MVHRGDPLDQEPRAGSDLAGCGEVGEVAGEVPGGTVGPLEPGRRDAVAAPEVAEQLLRAAARGDVEDPLRHGVEVVRFVLPPEVQRGGIVRGDHHARTPVQRHEWAVLGFDTVGRLAYERPEGGRDRAIDGGTLVEEDHGGPQQALRELPHGLGKLDRGRAPQTGDPRRE